MPVLTLETGCGCVRLRTTSFILGYLDLVLCIMMNATTVLVVASAHNAAEAPDSEEQRMAEVILVLSWVTLVYLLLMLAFTVTLLVGLHKNRRNLVKVYLVAAGVFFLIDFVTFFVGFVHSNSREIVAFRSVFLLLEAYSFVVIRSYYFKMYGSGKSTTYTTA